LEKYGNLIEDLPWGSGSGLIGPRAGHLFCARVGDRSFLRFVPLEAETILRDSLACLRSISCTEMTARVMSDETRERAYAAWSRVRQDIFNEWQFSTDPASLQPKVRPNRIREAMGEGATSEVAARIIGVVRRLGLQPFSGTRAITAYRARRGYTDLLDGG
jgi:hypothetical protein